jgi:hypothetical protein
MMARILFGKPGDWCSRHPRVMLGAVCLLVLLAQWLVDLAIPPVVMP